MTATTWALERVRVYLRPDGTCSRSSTIQRRADLSARRAVRRRASTEDGPRLSGIAGVPLFEGTLPNGKTRARPGRGARCRSGHRGGRTEAAALAEVRRPKSRSAETATRHSQRESKLADRSRPPTRGRLAPHGRGRSHTAVAAWAVNRGAAVVLPCCWPRVQTRPRSAFASTLAAMRPANPRRGGRARRTPRRRLRLLPRQLQLLARIRGRAGPDAGLLAPAAGGAPRRRRWRAARSRGSSRRSSRWSSRRRDRPAAGRRATRPSSSSDRRRPQARSAATAGRGRGRGRGRSRGRRGSRPARAAAGRGGRRRAAAALAAVVAIAFVARRAAAVIGRSRCPACRPARSARTAARARRR